MSISTFVVSAAGILAFVGALFLGSLVLPGIQRDGQPEGAEGTRRPYKLSGLVLFSLTTLAVGGWLFSGHSMSPLLNHFWSLFAATNLLAFVVTAALMLSGWRRGEGLLMDPAHRGESRLKRALLDIWLGAEKHPSACGVDLKMFAYHPSLIGLAVLNAAFASAQFERYGSLSPEMILYQAFTWLYLFTHYIREEFMLSTWDIIAEKFGFMLVWGDLVYVPYFYSIAGWWVVDYGWSPVENAWAGYGTVALAGLMSFHILAHMMFRGANWQKHRFKKNPNTRIWGQPAEALEGRILISGWWGVGRKLNYTGEIGVYFTFALCSGFDSAIPYILPASLVVLLVQRAWRDEQRCAAKYGPLWEQYRQHAKFRMFPWLY